MGLAQTEMSDFQNPNYRLARYWRNTLSKKPKIILSHMNTLVTNTNIFAVFL
jgi:hypothetical protein